MIFRLLLITCFATAITARIVQQSNELIVKPQDDVIDKLKNNSRSYDAARDSIIEAEDLLTTGGHLQLSNRESEVDKIFLEHKRNELEMGFRNPELNAPSMHFFKAKPLIEKSQVFQFLKKMPKGAVLHAHNSATVSSEWMVKNIFYMPDLLRCDTKEGVTILTFRQHPEKHNCATNYVRISEERQAAAFAQDYDNALERLINLYTPSPELEYPTIDKVWSKFQNMFRTIADVLNYLPAYRAYHRQMLDELYRDNVMYAEIRVVFNELYDIEGRTYAVEQSADELINIIEGFKNQHSNFFGAKLIYSAARRAGTDAIQKHFASFQRLHALFPNYIVGFDLVGQEDKGKPLHDFVSILNRKPKTAKYFFHAGETNWYGASTDLNLLDAILLNTTRIGHGYALMKHPLLYEAVRSRNITVEVSPISNQVLELVRDLRNHPGAFFISQNIPIVICNDDPGFWNSQALSYDFYYAIMSLASNNAGLKTLKQLAWNSIKYSALDDAEQRKAFALLQAQWDQFIENVLENRIV